MKKSHLILKHQHEQKAKDIFHETNINVTTSVQRHLGVVLGSELYREEYVKDSVKYWKQQLEILSLIAEMEPQSAYTAFVFGFKVNWRTSFPQYPILKIF